MFLLLVRILAGLGCIARGIGIHDFYALPPEPPLPSVAS